MKRVFLSFIILISLSIFILSCADKNDTSLSKQEKIPDRGSFIVVDKKVKKVSDNSSEAKRKNILKHLAKSKSFNGSSGNEFVAGRGSGGMGFRGTGIGGGTGYGRIGGTGDIDTGGGRGTKVSLSKGRKGERKVPRLKKGTASFSGFCKKSNIQKVVSRKSRSIRYCYEKELQRSRGLKGKVKLIWIIGMDGKVESVSVSQDTVKNSRMTSCLKRQVQRWAFDKPKGGKCKIAYPFIFTAD